MGRLSLLVNILVILAVATTLIGAGLMMGWLAVPGGGVAVATTRPPASGPLPTLNPTPSPEQTETPPPGPTVRPTAGGTHIVEPGETLSTIADVYGVPWLLIAEANGIAEPYIIQIGQELIIPLPEAACGGYQAYTVQPGDFIIAIANEYGVDPTELADFNYLVDWNSIAPGDLLCIPGPGWTPLPTPGG